MTESIPAEQVIRIDPNGKYILVFPMRLTQEEMETYRAVVDRWFYEEGGSPFLMVDGGVQVVKLEHYGETEAEESEDA